MNLRGRNPVTLTSRYLKGERKVPPKPMIAHQKQPAELQVVLFISGEESWTAVFCIPAGSPPLLGLLGLPTLLNARLWTLKKTGQNFCTA